MEALELTLPVLAFVIANRFGGLKWAIAAATAASVRSAYQRRRRGARVGWYLPVVTGMLIARGTIAIIFDSSAVYFGLGIATKALIGVGLMVSVLIGRPALAELAPLVIPFDHVTRAHPIYRRTMTTLTWVAAGFELLTSAWDVWLYNNASLNEFVIVRFVAGWVMGFAVTMAAIVWAHLRLSRIPGFPGILALFDPTFDDDEDDDEDDGDAARDSGSDTGRAADPVDDGRVNIAEAGPSDEPGPPEGPDSIRPR